MEFDAAKKVILELLAKQGGAKNSEMIDAIEGDRKMFDLVREDLIFNDLAEDKKRFFRIMITFSHRLKDRQPDKSAPGKTGYNHKSRGTPERP